MSFAPGILSRLLPKTCPKPFFRPGQAQTLRSLHTPASFRASLQPPRLKAIAIPRTLPRHSTSRTTLYTLGLGLTFLSYSAFSPSRTVQCQSISATRPAAAGRADDLPDSPQSILNLSELGFGAVTGICAGVFLKKGLKALAFLLGGAFVFLQYMSSRSLVNVDWAKLSSKYDETFGTRTSSGVRAPNVKGAYNWIVDFLTANFQQRASFLAGFALGIRMG